MKTTEVPQTSEPGRLGLSALVEKGFVGPPHAPNSLPLTFKLINKKIEIYFHDQSCSLSPEDPCYEKIKQYF